MSIRDYDGLVEVARADDRVLGLVLTGSRGRGPFARADSDWDVRLVVRDDALSETAAAFATGHGASVETVVFSLTDFECAGEIGSPTAWDRYSYAHAQVVLDKFEGRIGELVAAKGILSREAAREVATEKLDDYINAYYRSAKNLGDGLVVEGHLDAAESVSPFLTTLFALHERVRPFNKFLRWELQEYPLGAPLWAADTLLARLQRITSTGELEEQQQLFRDTEQLARERSLGDVVDSWQPDVPWLRGERR